MLSNSLAPTVLVDELRHCQINAFEVGALGLISFYDDSVFSNIDYDVIDSETRQNVRRCLLARGWKMRGSRIFGRDGISCAFPRPSHTLGCNPADKVRESLSDHQFHFVTPTQALLTLLAEKEWSVEAAEDLVYEHPSNLQKVLQWASHDGYLEGLDFPHERLKKIQEQGIKKRRGQNFESLELIRRRDS